MTVIDAELRTPTPVTPDGVGKGAVVDAGAAAPRNRVDAGLIEVGGSGSASRWRVGVEDPRGDGLASTARLDSGGAATSGDYRIYDDADRTDHHIVTPGTGRSPAEDTSVTIVASDAETVDAHATAAFVIRNGPASSLVEARNDLPAPFLPCDGDCRTAGARADG